MLYFIIQNSWTNLNSFIKKMKAKNSSLLVHIFYNLQNQPTFHSVERLVNLLRRRECFVANCWSINIISLCPGICYCLINWLFCMRSGVYWCWSGRVSDGAGDLLLHALQGAGGGPPPGRHALREGRPSCLRQGLLIHGGEADLSRGSNRDGVAAKNL